MSRLKAALQREFEEDQNTSIQLHNPRNTHTVELYFRGEKTAKVMGTLAVEEPQPGKLIQGILVKRNFNYHILSSEDLASQYTTPPNASPIIAGFSRIHRTKFERNHAEAKSGLFGQPGSVAPSAGASLRPDGEPGGR